MSKPNRCGPYPPPCRVVQCYTRIKEKKKIRLVAAPYYYCTVHSTMVRA